MEGVTQRTLGKESSLAVLLASRTQLFPDALVFRTSCSSHQPELGPAQPLAVPGWGQEHRVTKEVSRLQGLPLSEKKMRGQEYGLALGELILHVAIHPTRSLNLHLQPGPPR